jgi:hypothetical protein
MQLLEHSVETSAPIAFAWSVMTEISNWDDPPARFTLKGPFADGTPGMTEMPGQPPWNWTLRKVNPLQSYRIEAALDGAIVTFDWRFSEAAPDRTRLTQCVSLDGANASVYVADIQAAFGANLEPGMNKIAQAIGTAYRLSFERSEPQV